MKLRNKKTGEIMEGLELSVIEYGFGHEWMRDWSYNSIKAFLEDWEDVKENSPAEPLIKDEKIRKAVRAWAEANKEKTCLCYSADEKLSTDNLIRKIIEWAEERKIDNPILQYAKVNEEIGEIAHELTRNRRNSTELIDALGDSFVTLIILTNILGYDVNGVIEAAYEVIKDH